ncbi:hypothetical protein SAY86_021962 [Trapa natans]|uniref:Leucine-rich repeat-containing N-terminal plant-type domain-containing protein n=1 Tax=Trapa natans TaxID=22666 RepID=A0AAN7MT86_TRANT|nr:hypothetical protein SAY86_021962 [Trapa natans]
MARQLLHSPLIILHLSLILTLSPQSLQQRLSPVDLAALRSIKDSLTDLPGSHFFSTWDFASSRNPCSTFLGLTCSSSSTLARVTALSLGPSLAGSLPASISVLSELTQLILSPGIITGRIPPELGRLTRLRVISLPHNRLTGPIPASFSALRNLHTLDLSHNLISGTIPTGTTALPHLKVLILSSNRLSGGIPPVVTQLLHLDAKKNRLIGRIPQLPSTLRYLSLSENYLWGQLTEFNSASFPELAYLDLSMNRLSGPIPASLFSRPTVLSSMLLQRNYLSGVVPTTSPRGESYGPGSIVDLSHNALTGKLPPILAGVETLFLNHNRLIGPVPEEYVRSVSEGTTRTLYLQHNYLTGFPLERGMAVPDSVSLCLSYNCMVPPVGLSGCPASAGAQLSRPAWQCSLPIGSTAQSRG